MGTRKAIVKSDYTSGDVSGPFRGATSSDTIVDGAGGTVRAVSVYTTTANLTMSDTYSNILINAASNNIAIILPTAVGRSNIVFVLKRIDIVNGYSVTVTSAGGTMENQTSIGMCCKSSYSFVSDGTNWHIF